MSDDDVYLVWSNEHSGWWKPGGYGYSRGLDDAGHFSREVALNICRDAIPTALHMTTIAEIPVRLADMKEFLKGQVVPDIITRGEHCDSY